MPLMHLYHSEHGYVQQAVRLKTPKTKNYRKRVLWLILSLSVFRLALAAMLELGNDEAYYWLYSQDLKLNYFDHPSMVAFWIRLFTLSLWLQDEVFLRLGSIVGCALASWFMFRAVSLIHTVRAGWFAAILYNASFYSGLTAGLYIMPDSPQMVFWTFSLWMMAKIVFEEQKWINWILFGIGAGLCIMSKVHGAFLWLGWGLFILLKKRAWLKTAQPYVALLLTTIIASPILFWNIGHDFITYRFHSQRVSVDGPFINPAYFLRELFNQLYFNNPVNVTLIILALYGWRRLAMRRWEVLSAYNLVGLPLAGALLFVSFFKNTTLPHWSGPAYVSLIPLAAIYLASRNRFSFFPKQSVWALATFVVVLIGWTCVVHFYPGTFGSKKPSNYGEGDISLDLYGWKQAAEQFIPIYQEDIKKGVMPPQTPLVCTYWWGAHIEYYFCRPNNIEMIGLGTVRSIREYWWMNQNRLDDVNLSNAYCIMPVDEHYLIPTAFYETAELVKVIRIDRGGLPAHLFKVYRLKGWKGKRASL